MNGREVCAAFVETEISIAGAESFASVIPLYAFYVLSPHDQFTLSKAFEKTV